MGDFVLLAITTALGLAGMRWLTRAAEQAPDPDPRPARPPE